MTTKPRRVDIGEVSDLAALADEVNRTQQPCVVQRDGQDLVLVSPVQAKTVAKRSSRQGRAVKKGSILDLIGLGEGPIDGGISEPLKPKATARRTRKSGIVTEDDPLLALVGRGSSKGTGEISEHKHEALLEAHFRLHSGA